MLPHNVRPMLATPAEKPFNDDDWIFEVKFDGYRAIAEIDRGKVRLYSRNQLSLAGRFPQVAGSLKKFDLRAVLDGEIVAVDSKGRPDFQLLQHHRERSGRLIYYVFDILYHNDRDLSGLDLLERKRLLRQILPNDARVKFVDHERGSGVAFFKAVKKQGLEGMVAKHIKSGYRAGTRSRLWLKIKIQMTQDCVILGFTPPRRSREYLGSLVLGAFDKDRLIYVGHSGGSFGEESIKTIYDKLRPLIRKGPPLKTLPPERGEITWVKPVLVCEMAFTEWTNDGSMRHPRFVRLREDKSPSEAVLERIKR